MRSLMTGFFHLDFKLHPHRNMDQYFILFDTADDLRTPVSTIKIGFPAQFPFGVVIRFEGFQDACLQV